MELDVVFQFRIRNSQQIAPKLRSRKAADAMPAPGFPHGVCPLISPPREQCRPLPEFGTGAEERFNLGGPFRRKHLVEVCGEFSIGRILCGHGHSGQLGGVHQPGRFAILPLLSIAEQGVHQRSDSQTESPQGWLRGVIDLCSIPGKSLRESPRQLAGPRRLPFFGRSKYGDRWGVRIRGVMHRPRDPGLRDDSASHPEKVQPCRNSVWTSSGRRRRRFASTLSE